MIGYFKGVFHQFIITIDVNLQIFPEFNPFSGVACEKFIVSDPQHCVEYKSIKDSRVEMANVDLTWKTSRNVDRESPAKP